MQEEEELPRLPAELKRKTTETSNLNSVLLQVVPMEQVSQDTLAALVQQEKAGLVVIGRTECTSKKLV